MARRMINADVILKPELKDRLILTPQEFHMARAARFVQICNCEPSEVNNLACGCNKSHLLHSQKDPVILHFMDKHWGLSCFINYQQDTAALQISEALHREEEMRAKYIHMRELYEKESDQGQSVLSHVLTAHDHLKKFGDHLDSCVLRKFAESGRLPPKHMQNCSCGYNSALAELFDARARRK